MKDGNTWNNSNSCSLLAIIWLTVSSSGTSLSSWKYQGTWKTAVNKSTHKWKWKECLNWTKYRVLKVHWHNNKTHPKTTWITKTKQRIIWNFNYRVWRYNKRITLYKKTVVKTIRSYYKELFSWSSDLIAFQSHTNWTMNILVSTPHIPARYF